MKLSGKTVVITGASRGIGESLALEASQHGAAIHLLARNWNEGDEKKFLDAGAQSCRLWPVDLSDSNARKDFVASYKKETQSIDLLINNAGLLSGGLLESQKTDHIHKMLQVNLHAVIELTHAFLPQLIESGGKVVNNASVSGKMFFPCASTYAASKAGVVAFTECLKQELRDTPASTLLLITPGVKTEMYDEIGKSYGGNLDLSFMSSIPAKEWAEHVFRAIKNDEDTCWPKGSTWWGVKIGHHFPNFFAKVVKDKFHR